MNSPKPDGIDYYMKASKIDLNLSTHILDVCMFLCTPYVCVYMFIMGELYGNSYTTKCFYSFIYSTAFGLSLNAIYVS